MTARSTLVVAMLIVSTIAYPIEAVGTSLGWWEWFVDGRPWAEVVAEQPLQPFVAIPAVPLLGWPMFVGAFLFLSMGLERAVGARWWIKSTNSPLMPASAVVVGWFGSSSWIIFEMSLIASNTFGFS